MIIIYFNKSDSSNAAMLQKKTFFAASKKGIPAIVKEISTAEQMKLEDTINLCTYSEINTKQDRTGELVNTKPLTDIVSVECRLVKLGQNE